MNVYVLCAVWRRRSFLVERVFGRVALTFRRRRGRCGYFERANSLFIFMRDARPATVLTEVVRRPAKRLPDGERAVVSEYHLPRAEETTVSSRNAIPRVWPSYARYHDLELCRSPGTGQPGTSGTVSSSSGSLGKSGPQTTWSAANGVVGSSAADELENMVAGAQR